MKTCPICNQSYGDDLETCKFDGATLRGQERARDPLIGTVLRQRYKILEKFAHGTMSDTYLAEQMHVERRVLLKILTEEYAQDEAFVRRFRQEAKLLSSLNHPRLIQLYDFDQTDDGRLFIVTEFLQGKSLKAILQNQILDIATVVRLAGQLVDGLNAAHASGVVHRDINSESVLVIGDRAAIKITDFGLARVREGDMATRLTQVGTILGNPQYIAPEQIEGGETDERTDIYSLGIVLYEMLCNKVPFTAANPTAVWMQHLNDAPLPPSQLRPEIPAQLERIVMRAIEKKPENRWVKMAEIAQALNQSAKPSDQGRHIPRPTMSPAVETPRISPQPVDAGRIRRNPPAVNEPPAAPERRASEAVSPTVVIDNFAQTAPLERLETAHDDQKTIAQTMLMTEVTERAGRKTIRWQWLGLAAGLTVAATIGFYFIVFDRQREGEPTQKLPAAGVAAPAAPATFDALTLESSASDLKVGESGTLRLKARRSDGSQMTVDDSENISWTSSDPAVAIADRRGRINATGPGATEVRARYMGMESPPFNITVKAQAPLVREPKLLALSITSDKRELTLKETANLRASAQYSNNRVRELYQGLSWESNNPAVATVDSTGKLSARKFGQVEVVVRYGGIVSAPLALSVKKPAETQKPEPRPVKATTPARSPGVTSQLRNARNFLDQGQYNEALNELAQANRIDPGNKEIQAAIADAKRACNAEKRLGRSELKC